MTSNPLFSLNVLLVGARAPTADPLGGSDWVALALRNNPPSGVRIFHAYEAASSLYVVGPDSERPIARFSVGSGSGPHAMAEALAATIAGVRASVVDIHYPQLGPGALAEAIDASNARVVLTLHDHALACENHELLELGEHFCDLPVDPARCARCLSVTRPGSHHDVRSYRAAMAELVERADAVIVPSSSVLALVGRVQRIDPNKVRRLEWGTPKPSSLVAVRLSREAPLRIAVVGVLAASKGADRLPALFSATRQLDVEWHLFGATEGRSLGALRSAASRLVVHGAYRRHELAGRLERAGCAVALLPSIFPETFSLVLSELVAARVPVIGSRLGALGERIQNGGFGWTFDPFDPDELARLLERLKNDPELIERARARLGAVELRTEREASHEHARVWSEVARSERATRPTPERLSRALLAYERAASIPRSPWRDAIAGAVGALRRSNFYRDFPLRRVLPETLRGSIEAAARRIVERTKT